MHQLIEFDKATAVILPNANTNRFLKTYTFKGGSAPPRVVSPEVQAVYDRMSNLSDQEEFAIERFVDGLVTANAYAAINEIYAPCLNGTDYLTGFKLMTLVESPAAPTHTPGQFVNLADSTEYLIDPVNYDTFATVEGWSAVYNVFASPDTAAEADLFGFILASAEVRYRWEGQGSNAVEGIYNCSLSSRPGVRPTGDIVGVGLIGNEVFILQPGGLVTKGTETPLGIPAPVPFQWHGQSAAGVPGALRMANSNYSLMIHSNVLNPTVLQGSVRSLCLQFLRDIGVSGTPAP